MSFRHVDLIFSQAHPSPDGRYRILASKALEGKRSIWIHAVSVGEVLAVTDLIGQVSKAYSKYQIVCSTVTKTGDTIAREKLGDQCLVLYAPLDFSWIVRKFISVIKPDIYISAETEIWPNLYTALFRKG